MTPPQTIIAARDVRRRYGEGDAAVDALDGVTVGFETGRFTAIMGPSGSGKSTLMHILAGLDRPTSGSVTVDGTELTELDDRRMTELRRDRKGDGFTLSFPVGQLALLMVLAGLAGVLAAIGPARRAARLDVLQALAYE